MRTLSTVLLGLLWIISGTEALPAEVRTSDPPAHVNRLLDILENEGSKAFSEAVAEAVDNKEVSKLQSLMVPFEKRKAKVRAIALDRNYGGVIRQIVVYQYMLSEQFPFLYFRFVYKMTDEGWRLTNMQFDAEPLQPFPPNYGLN